jgi:integrative and conjugative element protein (TIGR02256 family)
MRTVVWLPARLLLRMSLEAESATPNETGGLLCGYIVPGGANIVIEHLIGPGPLAQHSRSRFVPDHLAQEQALAILYRDSGRITTYLGDWHSHPRGGRQLSRTDRDTLLRISNHAEARVSEPLMCILVGPRWQPVFWRTALGNRRLADRTVVCKLRVTQ